MTRAYGPNLNVNVVEGRTPNVVDNPFSKATGFFGPGVQRTTYNKNGLIEHEYSGTTLQFLCTSVEYVEKYEDQGFTSRFAPSAFDGFQREEYMYITKDGVQYPTTTFTNIPTVRQNDYDENTYRTFHIAGKNFVSVNNQSGNGITLEPFSQVNESVDPPQASVWVYTDALVHGIGRSQAAYQPIYTTLANAPNEGVGEAETFVTLSYCASDDLNNKAMGAAMIWYPTGIGQFTYSDVQSYTVPGGPTAEWTLEWRDDYYEPSPDRQFLIVQPGLILSRFDHERHSYIGELLLSDKPIASLGWYKGLPRRGVHGATKTVTAMDSSAKVVPAFVRELADSNHDNDHSRFMSYVKAVGKGVFIFPYFRNKMTYAQAKSAWHANEKTITSYYNAGTVESPNWQPVYTDVDKHTLTDVVSGGVAESDLSVVFDVLLGVTYDSFGTLNLIEDYTNVTITPIEYANSYTGTDRNKLNRLGAREFDGSVFETDMFPSYTHFMLTEPHTVPLSDDCHDFLIISSSYLAPPKTQSDKYRIPVYRVNNLVLSEESYFEFAGPVAVVSAVVIYGVVYVQIALDDNAGMKFYVSQDQGATWDESEFVAVPNQHVGVMTKIATPYGLAMPRYNEADNEYRMYYLPVAEFDTPDLVDGWKRGGKISSLDDQDDRIGDLASTENDEFMTRVSPIFQTAVGQDWDYKLRDKYRDNML